MLPFTPIISNNFLEIARLLTNEHISDALFRANQVLLGVGDDGYYKLWHTPKGKKLLWPLKRYADTLHTELRFRAVKNIGIFDGVMRRLKSSSNLHPTYEQFLRNYNGPTRGIYPTWPNSVINTHYDYLAFNFPNHYPAKERKYVVGLMPPTFVCPAKCNSLAFFKE